MPEIQNDTEKVKKKIPFWVYIIIIMAVIALAAGGVVFYRISSVQKLLNAGDGYLEAEAYDEAEEAFQEAMDIMPSSADAYLGLAEAYIAKDDLTGAINILDNGINRTGSENLKASKDEITDQVYATYVMNEYLVNILPEETFQMTMTNRSEDMGFNVTWSMEDESIATIDESSGLIKAIKDGTTVITAHLGNDAWGYRDETATLVVGIMSTYMEDNGYEFADSAETLTAPAFVYQENSDGFRIYDGTLDIEQQDAEYRITESTRSDPDIYGNVTVEITYTVTVPMKFGIKDGSKEATSAWYYNWAVNPLVLCDEYTGMIFGEQSLYGQDGPTFDSDVEWNNLSFHISGNELSSWYDQDEWTSEYDEDAGITWAERTAVGTYTLSMQVPKDYEGLTLALYRDGVTDYTDEYNPDDAVVESTDETESEESTAADSYFDTASDGGEVRNGADYIFVSVGD